MGNFDKTFSVKQLSYCIPNEPYGVYRRCLMEIKETITKKLNWATKLKKNWNISKL